MADTCRPSRWSGHPNADVPMHGCRQALAALVSNAESAPSSSRRRRSSAGSDQSLQDLHDQLHRAKEILAVRGEKDVSLLVYRCVGCMC
jgi:hypothetical protein